MGRLVPVLIPVVKADYGYTPYTAGQEKSPMPNAAILAGGAAGMYGGAGIYNAIHVKSRAKRGSDIFRQQFKRTMPGAVEATARAKEYRAKLGPAPKTGVNGKLTHVDPIRALQERRADSLANTAKTKRTLATHYAHKVRQARQIAANPGPTSRAMLRSGTAFAGVGAGLVGWGAYKRIKEAQQP